MTNRVKNLVEATEVYGRRYALTRTKKLNSVRKTARNRIDNENDQNSRKHEMFFQPKRAKNSGRETMSTISTNRIGDRLKLFLILSLALCAGLLIDTILPALFHTFLLLMSASVFFGPEKIFRVISHEIIPLFIRST